MPWRFFGRQSELQELQTLFGRERWFFLKVEGRRRIGKTSLVQQALSPAKQQRSFYMQIPDSTAAGVLARFNDACEGFGILDKYGATSELFPAKNLLHLAKAIGLLIRAGWIVILDEFQYFNRKALFEFNSFLQETIDGIANSPETVTGGLIVLGSLHTEMSALLEDKRAPLYARSTNVAYIDHLDSFSIAEILLENDIFSPERMLFLWTLFEGVPKFYRDAYEQGVLGASRQNLLEKLFFSSAAPLRYEAENWFLAELRGRYDAVLNALAKRPMSDHGTILQLATTGDQTESREQIAQYMKILIDKYHLVQRQLPIFSKPNSRGARYRICDNFLMSWLNALQSNVHASEFRPLAGPLSAANSSIAILEGFAFEHLVTRTLRERSRRGLGDILITRELGGFWNKDQVEIDLVAIDDESKTIRFGSCKRNPEKSLLDIANLKGHVERFFDHPRASEFKSWNREYLLISPSFSKEQRAQAKPARDVRTLDLHDLLKKQN